MATKDADTAEILSDLTRRRRWEESRLRRRSPKTIRDIVAQAMLRGGYGRVQASEELAETWQKIVGEQFAEYCRPGRLRRGVLEVLVTHSAFVQELTTRKETILAGLAREAPHMKIRDLRFRTGRL